MKRPQYGLAETLQKAGMTTVLMLTIAACTNLKPDYKRPENLDLPTTFDTNESRYNERGMGTSRWWEVFNDATLNQLVERAHEHNIDLIVGALRVVEARTIRGVASSALLPAVDGFAVVARSHASDNSLAFGKNVSDYQIGTRVRWEIDFWGRIKNSIESSNAQLLATEADYQSLRNIVAAEVVATYIQLRGAEAQLLLAQENVNVQKDLLRNTLAMFEQGGGTQLDVAQAEAIYADTKALVPILQYRRSLARNGLAVLLAYSGDTIETLLGEKPASLPGVNTAINLGVPADLLRQRPDIVAAEFRAMAAAAQLGVAEAEKRPNIILGGDLLFQVTEGVPTLSGGNNGSEPDSLFNAESLAFSIVPSVNLPLFDGGRRANNARAADARYQSSLEELRRRVIVALNEVDNAVRLIRTASNETEHLKTSVDAYATAYETAFIQYAEGDTSFTTVLDSLRQRVMQEQRYVQAQTKVASGFVDLFRSLGGSWDDTSSSILQPEIIQQMQKRTHWDKYLEISNETY